MSLRRIFSPFSRKNKGEGSSAGAVHDSSHYSSKPAPVEMPTPSVPPPAYSQTYGPASEERALARLREYDTIFVIDDSSSMCNDATVDQTRWDVACEALAEFSEIAARYDKDGIDIHFLNSPRVGKGLKPGLGPQGVNDVRRLFMDLTPSGMTYIGKKLESLLTKDYIKQMELASKELGAWPKRLNFMIITDGEASGYFYCLKQCGVLTEYVPFQGDAVDLKKFLRDTANTLHKLRAPQAQIGNDKHATRFLEDLDGDCNKNLPTDIVDTVKSDPGKPFDADLIKKVLLGGINRGFDHKD
ncbi:hypothetical protein CC1G_08145 [Coprinopsis cinerea okayama7|uniref:VWFA domain-containing protein n=1 Tax=Coprinopsis cinerea (strain Okayama-7 / 130 / ATCC MYA-4618 / FGSC 9003) TaxID=240176 RepID=A8NZ32_COPC7|nr:hypothetical protein CC1G_08145 [Coprinopsis cinerea okayama7\|eukprot:XP_001837591.2 hypothetical protein CC1G_08145 [Coprinopsis cinerea okayama7\